MLVEELMLLGFKRDTKKTRRGKKVEDGLAESGKRKLNEEQLKFLEMNFERDQKLECGRKMSLATELGLDPRQVAVWFQNRRTRWKNKQLEEKYMKLKSQYDAVIVQECQMKNEVLSLSKRLAESEEKIRLLSAGSEEVRVLNSWSMENCEQHDLGDQSGDTNDLLYINNHYNYIID